MTSKENGPADFAKSTEPINSNQYKNTDFISDLKSEIQSIAKSFEENATAIPQSGIGLFTVMPANNWIEQAEAGIRSGFVGTDKAAEFLKEKLNAN